MAPISIDHIAILEWADGSQDPGQGEYALWMPKQDKVRVVNGSESEVLALMASPGSALCIVIHLGTYVCMYVAIVQ